jgi:hypothetical protein
VDRHRLHALHADRALGLFGAGVYLHEVVTANGWTTGPVSGAVTLPALNENGRKKP